MQRKILELLIRFVSRVHLNTSVALKRLRRHLYFMDFEEREDDIYLVTFLKSGTTWMQVILYNLLTNGDMDFEHIYDVSPWPSNQAFKGQSTKEINSLPSPRILKFHDSYKEFDENFKNKIIYVFRDGKDLAVSLYHHNKNYVDPDLTFEKNFENHFTDPEKNLNYFKYNSDWFENKNRFNILYISYESLKNDFDNTLERIAQFLNIKLTDEIIERAKKYSSFEYMKANETKFGEIAPKKELVFNEFIRKGEIGEGKKYLSDEMLKIYDENFDKYLSKFFKKKV